MEVESESGRTRIVILLSHWRSRGNSVCRGRRWNRRGDCRRTPVWRNEGVHHIPLGLIGLCIGIALILTEVWLIYMVHAYTEKAEALLPRSSFVEANKAAYSQAGFIGKGMRNGFLTLVLAIPGICAKRGILDIYDASAFPKKLKRMLFWSEWIPTTGYRTAQEAQRDISQFLMYRYNWVRPHQFNGGLAPARAEEKLNIVSGIS
jgi:hypothetical protein